MIIVEIFLKTIGFKTISPYYNGPRTYIMIGKKHISFSSIRGISSKNIILGSSLETFSRENKYDFILNNFETYQFLPMFHKTSVNCTNIWDFWSSFKTKTFNGVLSLSHLSGHQSFPTVVMYLTFLQHILPIWRSCCSVMEFSYRSDNLSKIFTKSKFHKYHWQILPEGIHTGMLQYWYIQYLLERSISCVKNKLSDILK